MIEVYIDESGNMGREGDYFVLGATVVKDLEVKNKLREVVLSEKKIGNGGELKFAKLKANRRKRVVGKIARTGVEVFYFTAYKPEVTLFGGEMEKNLIYNYFCRLLMQRVLKRYGDDFLIMFDKRTEAAKAGYLGLKEYIKYIAYEEFPHLKKRTIQVVQADSRDEALLQVADIVVGAAAQGYNNQEMYFLKQLGNGILMMDEFPKKRFKGGVKRLV